MTKVLIVDDDPDVVSGTATLLRLKGFDVATCVDARQVTGMVKAEHPDVMLQDYRMPGLDVPELVAGLRRDRESARTRIVIFSASWDLEEARERAGADDAIGKPFDLADLVRVLERNAKPAR